MSGNIVASARVQIDHRTERHRLMEIREFAEQVLLVPDLDTKLRSVPDQLTDDAPGTAQRVMRPARPEQLQFAPRRTAPGMPAPGALRSPEKRAIAHHIMANHELQALEVMAWMLLAFPDAPPEFRQGMCIVMRDEQRHTRMHVERAAKLGIRFGELPVNSYIWGKAMEFQSVLDYLAGLPLVFEGRNLDHSLELEAAFLEVGDERSAAIMHRIHEDEIEHVRFGIEWLRRLKPQDVSDWEAFESHLHWPIRPCKARGDAFQRDARIQAGLSPEFIDAVEAALDEEHDK